MVNLLSIPPKFMVLLNVFYFILPPPTAKELETILKGTAYTQSY